MLSLESTRLWHGFKAIEWPTSVEAANADPDLKTSYEEVQKLLNPYRCPAKTGKSFVLTQEIHDTMRKHLEKHCAKKKQEEDENDLGADVLQKETEEIDISLPVAPEDALLYTVELFTQEEDAKKPVV